MTMRTLAVAMTLSALAALTACGSDDDGGSSNRGSGTETDPISVENVFVVPAAVPGNCTVQIGGTAALRYVVSNSSSTTPDRLVSISTAQAERVETAPALPVDIPVNTTTGSGQPARGADALTTRLVGLRDAAAPGVSFDVRFTFATAGEITVRVPVEACPVR
ncbi:copper chaperone PCu(A)C [Williamsia maris]|nr:copper chaperone PCu(A)C [Williamsia maris]